MKHVVTAARFRQTVLVTGFGAFPGASRNPSAAIVAALGKQEARLARLGVDLRRALLPVVFATLDAALRDAVERHRPDAILHLGLASRRRHISVETRSVNRAGILHPDAAGGLPGRVLVPGGPATLPATYPAARIAAALRRHGFRAALSRDAGDYVCNAALYRSLLAAAAPQVGFVHVPRAKPAAQPRRRSPALGRPTVDALTRAALTAILVTAATRRGRSVDGGDRAPPT